jgi:hypothetical protein
VKLNITVSKNVVKTKFSISDGTELTNGVFILIASGSLSTAEISTFFGLRVNK